jgi:hypothetical protein
VENLKSSSILLINLLYMLSVLQKQYQSIEVNNKNFQVKFKNSDKFGDFLIHLKEK